jgi:hypothetical protein
MRLVPRQVIGADVAQGVEERGLLRDVSHPSDKIGDLMNAVYLFNLVRIRALCWRPDRATEFRVGDKPRIVAVSEARS